MEGTTRQHATAQTCWTARGLLTNPEQVISKYKWDKKVGGTCTRRHRQSMRRQGVMGFPATGTAITNYGEGVVMYFLAGRTCS